MAGRGPQPKDPGKRARTNGAPQLRVIHAEPVVQPDLPEFDIQVTVDDTLVSQEFVWPDRTRQWWQMWADSPLSAEFTSTDWSELLDTALLHAAFWSGTKSVASELRLRVAKFGATPEDRARLRITFAQAEQAEEKTPARASSKGRRGPLKAVDEPEAG